MRFSPLPPSILTRDLFRTLYAWRFLALGGLSGALFWASIPKADLEVLAWICLVPGLVVLPLLSPARSFALGLSAGIIAGTGRIYWIAETLQRYGNLSLPLAVFTTALLILYLALYWGGFFAVCRRFQSSILLFPWFAASVWVMLEWAQTWIISGFPWELLGYSQYRNLALLQLASVTGIYGISFSIVLVNAGLAQAIIHRSSLRLALFSAGLPLLLLAAAMVLGQRRLERLEAEASPSLTVGIVQGNIPQEQKWKTGRKAGTTQHYLELARTLPADQLDLIVFPETALPFFFDQSTNAEYKSQIQALAIELQTPLLIGSLGGSWEEGIFNRAYLIDAEGVVRDFADKVHLVPFGEYLPFAFIFRYLQGLTAESGAFSPGQGYKVLHLPKAELPFGVFICYESIFPTIPRTLASQGAALLINTTNDAWFGRTAAPYQHFAMVAVRAVETGRSIVRVANTGISGLIAPSGRILRATPLFETLAFAVPVSIRSAPTFYVRHGDLFLLLCAVFLVALGLRTWLPLSRSLRFKRKNTA